MALKFNPFTSNFDVVSDNASSAATGVIKLANHLGGTALLPTVINFTLSGDASANSHKITSLLDGTSAGDAVNLGQLTAAVEGRQNKDPAMWATTGNITLSGLGTQTNGEWTGTLTAGTRILVKSQSASADDGVYLAASGAWTRSLDTNTGTEITNASVLVLLGATLTGDTFTQTNLVTTIGTDAQMWTQTGEGATYVADGTSITLTGVTFSRNALTGDITASAGSSATVLKNTGPGATGPIGSASTTPVVTIDAQGRTTALTSAAITPAAIGAPSGSGTAPNGSVIFFPAGVYQFNGAVTIGTKSYIFQGVGANRAGSPATAYTELQMITSVVGFLTLTASYWYTQFRDLTFTAATNQTSGAVVAVGNNVGVNFFNVGIQGNGATWFNGIDFTGANSANSTSIDNCVIQGFTNHGVIINSNGASPTFLGVNIQGQWGTSSQTALSCMNVQIAGAVQIDDCDFIGANNNLLINPIVATVVASVQVSNTYFDNSNGSCLKISGAGATVRCMFVGSTFTTSNATTGLSAVEISTTVAAGAQGIDFVKCNIFNTFATTGTTNGFLVTGAADMTIIGCKIAGWTNGLNLTPHTTAAASIFKILGNTVGTSGGFGVNSVGILLNAGAATYGALQIENNDCSGNTTPLTNNLTTNIPATSGRYRITDNSGINPKGTVTTPGVPTAGTTVTNTTGYRINVFARNGGVAPTAIVVNGVSTANHTATVTLGGNTIVLDPGGTIAFTTTTVSGWTWIAN